LLKSIARNWKIAPGGRFRLDRAGRFWKKEKGKADINDRNIAF